MITSTRALAETTSWNAWSWYWLCWLIVTVPVGFLIPEVYALASGHSENTLSAQVWRLEQFVPDQHIWQWSAAHILIGGCLAVILLWMMIHFVFGIWR